MTELPPLHVVGVIPCAWQSQVKFMSGEGTNHLVIFFWYFVFRAADGRLGVGGTNKNQPTDRYEPELVTWFVQNKINIRQVCTSLTNILVLHEIRFQEDIIIVQLLILKVEFIHGDGESMDN